MDDFIRHLKEQVDLVRIVNEYVPLRKAGPARYKACCPFHDEKTPSFHVHATEQFYKCFGCGEGGDVIKFVERMERLTFWEAVKLLAERHGIPLPQRSQAADEESKRRGRLSEMLELAVQTFRRNLQEPVGEEVRGYLERRGVSREATEEFQLGLSERSGYSLYQLLERRGFAPAEMVEAGLAAARQDGSGYYDRFRGRLMFPIHSEAGKVIGFGGRALAKGDEPKYLNSAESPLYRKSEVLYNLNRSRKAIQESGYAVLVEGYMDVIGVWSAGVKNVVATCGTAMTQAQVRIIRRHAPSLVINFDPDQAGSNAAERAIAVVPVEEEMQLRICTLAGGLDPDEFVQKNGPEAYRKALADAPNYWLWFAGRERAKLENGSPEGRSQLFQVLLKEIHRVPDKVKRLSIANDLAEFVGIGHGMVLEEFRKAAAERRAPKRDIREEEGLDPNEVILLHALIGNAEAREQILPVLKQLAVIKKYRTWPVFEALFRLLEGGEAVSFASLEPRLGEPAKTLLSAVLLDDQERVGRSEVTVDQAVACVHALARTEKEAQREELRSRIRQAERAGNLEEALRASQELVAMERGRQ